jgi:nitroreductase
MDINKAINERFSCRKYLAKKISNENLNKILKAAIRAPNAGNLQSFRFLVVTDEDMKEKITSACLDQRWMTQAPVFIVICSDLNILKEYYSKKYEIYGAQDTSLAAQNIILTAFSLNIKSCFISSFHEGSLKRVLNLKKGLEPYCVITLGYSEESKITRRKSLDVFLIEE